MGAEADVARRKAQLAARKAVVRMRARKSRKGSLVRRAHLPILPSFLVVTVVLGVSAVAMAAPHPRGARPAKAGLLLPANTGPCGGAPPGCGSPQSSARALASGHWSTFPSGPLKARQGQVEAWTGSELLVWGGAVSPTPSTSAARNNGAAYDPTTQSWQMLPPSPLTPREDAAAAWTGNEMVVVGGQAITNPSAGGGPELASAAAYSPATNSWRRLPDFPLEPRTNADAIWTGLQLIVVGGDGPRTSESLYQPTEYLDGAVYDPATNTWATLPALPSDPGQSVYSATFAWTGSQLFAWVTWLKVSSCGNGCTSYREHRSRL